MQWELKPDRPIYIQLVEQIELQIASGQYQPGERLPAVRELATQAEVNPNTMQKALAELERKGLVYTQRTSGRYITEDEAMVKQLRQLLAQMQINDFLERMLLLGCTKEQAAELLERAIKERVE